MRITIFTAGSRGDAPPCGRLGRQPLHGGFHVRSTRSARRTGPLTRRPTSIRATVSATERS